MEGIVEDINFRSTKIRTFSQALVTVPNATLANEAITNWSRSRVGSGRSGLASASVSLKSVSSS
ncbi:mechanosensitive ion channel domain-containing protein [Bacillus sp. ISL-77]|uniref:mechanosensitive ion channel domain-containing protein n=1 Tax=Bacillus sp. ISL-77 TaxID=2819138 RepID=UPI0027E1A6C9|nr:mechanosensitive ion channel domain-containing protein [Bacillus sp. ISL-77]